MHKDMDISWCVSWSVPHMPYFNVTSKHVIFHLIFIFHSTWRMRRKLPEPPVWMWSTLAEQHLSACFADSFPVQVFPLHSFNKNASLFICRPARVLYDKNSSCFSTLGIPLLLESQRGGGARIPSRRTCQESHQATVLSTCAIWAKRNKF